MCLLIPVLAAGCGEESESEDRPPAPIADPLAGPRATAAFESVARLEALTGSLSAADDLAVVYGIYVSSVELLRVEGGAHTPDAPSATQKGNGARCTTASAGRFTIDGCEYAGTTVVVDGDFRFTDSTVAGDISVDAQSASSGGIPGYHLQATYDVVRTDGCATGGTIEVSATGEFSGSRYLTEYHHVRAEFGPSCGEVTVY